MIWLREKKSNSNSHMNSSINTCQHYGAVLSNKQPLGICGYLYLNFWKFKFNNIKNNSVPSHTTTFQMLSNYSGKKILYCISKLQNTFVSVDSGQHCYREHMIADFMMVQLVIFLTLQ